MKALFLDVDGVLNSHKYISHQDVEDTSIYTYLDKSKILLLKKIILQTDAVLVLSSSWRFSIDENLMPIDYLGVSLMKALKNENLTLFDKTEDIRENRYEEIKSWLNNHSEVTNYIILDDEDFDWKELKPNWIKTSYYIGLTDDICNEIIRRLE